MKSITKNLAALLFTLGLALPGMALACGPGGPGGGDGGHFKKGPGAQKMVRMLEKNAEKLGIEQATLDQIKQIVDSNKAEAESLRADAKAAGQALRTAMKSDSPDKAEVLALSAQAGQARQAAQQQKLAVMLDIRALLTPDQQAALKEMRGERRGKRGKDGKRGRKGKRGGPDAEL